MGLRVKELLKEKGSSMKELADQLGIVNDTLTRNLKNPQLKTLERIADTLGVSVYELFDQPKKDEAKITCPHCGKGISIIVDKIED